jgi:hypothetical protein
MRFTRAERAAIQTVLDGFDRRQTLTASIDELLRQVATMVDADHAELSEWTFDDSGKQLLLDRITFDPNGLSPALLIIPADERSPARDATAAVRTWTTDTTTPGRGGPALLSAREAPHGTIILLGLRRADGRRPFTPRQAHLIDALNRIHLFADGVTRLTSSRR